jgi:hypothetical protein
MFFQLLKLCYIEWDKIKAGIDLDCGDYGLC